MSLNHLFSKAFQTKFGLTVSYAPVQQLFDNNGCEIASILAPC